MSKILPDIIISRFETDPTAQGVIKPANGSWQLVIDKEGYPHLYLQVKIEDDAGQPVLGMLCLDDMLPDGLSIQDLMSEGMFSERVSPAEEAEAFEEYSKDRQTRKIPCPRL